MSRESNPEVVGAWEELRVLVESLDLDVRKNARGNVSAGIRARKGLRMLKDMSADLVRTTIAEEKRLKAEKRAKREAESE